MDMALHRSVRQYLRIHPYQHCKMKSINKFVRLIQFSLHFDYNDRSEVASKILDLPYHERVIIRLASEEYTHMSLRCQEMTMCSGCFKCFRYIR